MISFLAIGLIGALATGFAIGIQSTLSSRIGSIIGSFKTGVLVNLTGGVLAGVILLLLLVIKGPHFWKIDGSAFIFILLAGAVGILIITGVAFSLQRTGIAAGLATLLLGQMAVSVIADANGWGGAAPIPISWARIAGLIVISIGIFLLLPRK